MIGMISLTHERGLPWLRHKPLQSLSLRFGTNSFLLCDPLYKLVNLLPLFVLSRLLSSPWVSCTGSASDWCAKQEALYKSIDTIQYMILQQDSSTYLQCTITGPASGGVMALTRLMKSRSGVGWSGTPWSGQAVNWNWRTSRFSW